MNEEHATQGAADDANTPVEVADLIDSVNQPKPSAEAARPVRYLWPTLAS